MGVRVTEVQGGIQKHASSAIIQRCVTGKEMGEKEAIHVIVTGTDSLTWKQEEGKPYMS